MRRAEAEADKCIAVAAVRKAARPSAIGSSMESKMRTPPIGRARSPLRAVLTDAAPARRGLRALPLSLLAVSFIVALAGCGRKHEPPVAPGESMAPAAVRVQKSRR